MTHSTDQRYKFRTVFLSDIHLGSRNCKAKMLREFLNRVEAETIYLVGDIIDGERLRLARHWPQAHEQVLHLLHDKAARGTRVVYIPGNHDDALRDWLSENGIARGTHEDALHYRAFEFKQEAEFIDASGHRHRVLHGDKHDGLFRPGQKLSSLSMIGDLAYDLASLLNRSINGVREPLGLSYWSFSGWCKSLVKKTVDRLNGTEDKLVAETKALGYDSVFFGHTHMALNEKRHDITLHNDGDWVDSITSIVEAENGQRSLLHWAPVYSAWRKAVKSRAEEPQRVFNVLAEQYGATPQPAPADHPLLQFDRIAKVEGNVRSSYQDIIDLATHGPRPVTLPSVAGIGASLRP